mgnify:FL=1|jgi:repressor LexA
MSPLSPKQLKVLEFIRRFMETSGLPPTRGEIAQGLGLKNRQGIDQHLRALEQKGAIELLPGLSRGIRLREEVAAPPQPHPARQSPTGLPLLGRIAAGAPILAVENIEEHVAIDGSLFSPHADFLLRVRGDSMRDANILDGDLLAVHRTAHADNGQIVVARLDDEATVKYYERRGHRVRLVPANADYVPIEIDLRQRELVIEGLAVGVLRRDLPAWTPTR